MARSKKRDLTKFTLRNRSRLSMELLEPRLNLALDVPVFSSLPGANHTIYLDFDGHVTSGTAWNNGATINSPAYSSDADTANFSASELNVIERTFKRVSEDFAPFQVNVTTVAPTIDDLRNTGGTDTKWGVRVVVTKDVAFNCGCGGIAYIDSFDWNSDTPVFVFNTSEIGVAEAASHEVGHSLGLSHDGTSTSSYYQGHGLGTDTSYWSPIMGVGYYVDVSQWDKGEYTGSNNAGASANYNKGPDDLYVITNYNGFGYKSDDHGNDAATASQLNVVGTNISGSGLITTRTDVDYFSFTTSAAAVTLNVNSAPVGANLDIEAKLYNSVGTLVASSNPFLSLNASIIANLDAGTYYLKIDGTGAGTPTATPPTGYSDYASIGQYSISGTIGAVAGDMVSIVSTDASKNELNSGSTAFTFTVNRTGDTSLTSTVSYAVTGSGASPASADDFVGGVLPAGLLTFDTGVISLLLTVYVQGDTTVENNETFLMSLSSSSSVTLIGVATATGTIVNDDVAPGLPTLGFSTTSVVKAEGTGSASTPFVFTITRSGSLTAASSVLYTVTSTGTNGANSKDFAGGFARNVAVGFSIGAATADITINVRADSNREPDETFRVALSGAVGATISTASANGTIQNDDGTGAARDAREFDVELIAVADPLWMFVSPEFLNAEQLSTPVVTWIDGVAYEGDLAHDHDHELADDELLAEQVSLAAPLIFGAPSMQLSSILYVGGLTHSVSSLGSLDELQKGNGQLSVERSGYAAKLPLVTEDSYIGVESGTDSDLQVKLSSSMFAAFDSAFADSEDDAWSEF